MPAPGLGGLHCLGATDAYCGPLAIYSTSYVFGLPLALFAWDGLLEGCGCPCYPFIFSEDLS